MREGYPAPPPSEFSALIARIASGELHGAAAFDAVVDFIAVQQTPPGASAKICAQVRDEVILGVSHDQVLCQLLYEPQPAVSDAPDRRLSAPLPVSGEYSAPRTVPSGLDVAVSDAMLLPVDERPGRRGPRRSGSARRKKPRRSRAVFDADAQFMAKQQRNRILAGLGAVIFVAAAGYGWAMTRPDECDRLAKQICLESSGECVVAEVRQRLLDDEVDSSLCQLARRAAADGLPDVVASKRALVYTQRLVDTLGFDPRRDISEQFQKDSKEPAAVVQAEEVVRGQWNMTRLFADRAHLFWTISQPPGVYRARNLGGGAVETLATHPDPIAVTPTRDFVYWVSRGPEQSTVWVDHKRGQHEPFSIPLEGFSPVVVAFGGGEFGFVDGPTGAVMISDAEGQTRKVTEPNLPAPTELVIDATHLYWIVPSPTASLIAAPRQGGPSVVLAQGLAEPQSLVTDPTHLYLIEASDSKVLRVPKAGGPPQVLATSQAGPKALAVDEERVFWTNEEAGAVMAIPKTGGNVVALATSVERPTWIVADGAAVYWETGGMVMRLPK